MKCSDYALSILEEFKNFDVDLYLADFLNILEHQQKFKYDNPEHVKLMENNLKLKQKENELKNHIIAKINQIKTHVPQLIQDRLSKAFTKMAKKLKLEMHNEMVCKDSI